MVGTEFRDCPMCHKRSRNNKVWWCPHCGYNRPKRMIWDVEPIKAERWSKSKPRKANANLTAKAIRKAERDKLAEDIAELKRPDISKLRVKVGLRVLPK